MKSTGISEVKDINSTRARDALQNEPGTYIMCSKTHCSRCRHAMGPYESLADSGATCYKVDEKKDRCGLFNALGFDMYPMIIKSEGGGRYTAVTSRFI